MDYYKQFDIQFSGLALGKHLFEYDIEDKYFEGLEFSEIRRGNVAVKLEMERQERMLILDFELNGQVEVMCDRCGDDFFIPVEGEDRLLVKIAEEEIEDTDEVVYLKSSESAINVSHFIYEYICLALPMRKIHPEDKNGNSGCNADVLSLLNIDESEIETAAEENSEENNENPMWEALKKLKSNN